MNINYDDKGVTFINKSGKTTNLDWYEFWKLCRYGRALDTISEVKNYLECCDEIAGVSVDEILSDEMLVAEIADSVIDAWIEHESGDDIWEVANYIIKNRRKTK